MPPIRPSEHKYLGHKGSASLEFGIVGSVFFTLVFGILAAGFDGFYQMALDDAVRVAARQLQLGGAASTASGFVAAVCNEFGKVASNCAATLSYNVQTNTPPSTYAAMVPLTMPPNGALPNAFPSIPANANVVIQVAYPMAFSLPFLSTSLTLTGTNSILAITVVHVEPHG